MNIEELLEKLPNGSYLHKTGAFGTLVYYKDFTSLVNVNVTKRQQSDETKLQFIQGVVDDE